MSTIKRVLVLSMVAIVLAGGLTATTLAEGRGHNKSNLCHLTGNGGFVQISVAAPAVDAHLSHGDSMPDDYGECPPGDGGGGGGLDVEAIFTAFFNAFFNALFDFLTRFFGQFSGSGGGVGVSLP